MRDGRSRARRTPFVSSRSPSRQRHPRRHRHRVAFPPAAIVRPVFIKKPCAAKTGETAKMPTSTTASHGGVLYYVVKVPKNDPVSATASHGYLEEKHTLSPLNLR